MLDNKNKKWIELGDIIEIISPDKPEWHENKFFVSYIDNSLLELIELKSVLPFLFRLSADGFGFEDTSIQKVKVLSRSAFKGYARQNKLIKNTWVDLFFGGDVPKSITAEITNLEEDMIELTTYPENKILYIDFAYQGVPRNIPLSKICIREKPASFHRGLMHKEEELEELEEESLEKEQPSEESKEVLEETYQESLQKKYKLQELEEDSYEELREVIQPIEIPPEQQRYGIHAQVNDLLDAFLSTIPDYKRTPQVMDRIYTHIQRFKELREQFSIFDEEYHQIIGPKRGDTQPLVNELFHMRKTVLWCIPVVSQTKNLYGNFVEDYTDVNTKDPEEDAINEVENENRTFYKNNIPDENIVKYANMYIQNASYMSPFTITDLNSRLALYTLPTIQTDIDVIVSSDVEKDSLYSNVALPFEKSEDGEVDADIIKTKFLMERYNTEIQYPYKKNAKSKESSLFTTLFPSDKLAFRSLFTLPEPFIAFSKIRLPNTNILQKTSLHRNYPYFFRYLNKHTFIKEKSISLSDNDNNDTDTQENNISFLQFQHFILSEIDDTAQSLDEPQRLLGFLQKTIPTLYLLINDYLQKQNRKTIYTFLDAVDILEPFLLYFENMNWKIANTIKQLLYKNIDKYKTEILSKQKQFQSIVLAKYKYELQELKNTLLFLLEEAKEQQKKCIESYNNSSSTTSEWLKNIQVLDESRTFALYLRIINSDLYTSEDLLGETEKEVEEAKTEAKDSCWKRVITKKYYSVSDLRKDNGTSIIVDKELDTTDYTLIAKFKEEQPDTNDTEFLEYVAEKLITKYNYERDNAFKIARNMIAGEREVEEGEYAILENHPKLKFNNKTDDELSEKEKEEVELESETKKRVMYYIRKKNTWIHVPELDELSFVDNNTLICNIQENCYKSSKKKSTCSDTNTTLKQFREQDIERMRLEFKNRYDISIEEKKQELETELLKSTEWIHEHKQLYQNELTFLDIQCYNRGTNAVLQEFIISPYTDLRDTILAKNVDFITRQSYILLFVDKYCREPFIDEPMSENVHWLYCKETNTKLMPRSLFLLAKAFKENNYSVVLDRLCNTIGKLSDDGDSYIDKYSGYFLKKIEYREEGFEIEGGGGGDEDIWEKSYENNFQNMAIIIQNKKQNKIERIFLNEIDQKIYNIISAICSNIHLENENDSLKDTMMQLCQDWLQIPALFINEKTYMKKVYNPMMEKRKDNPKLTTPDDYDTYNNKLYVIISAISVLVVIQTAIPSIIINKTFSRCIKSFNGYPLKEGQDDLSSIKYIGCVLREMYSRSKENLVSKSETVIENNILNILKQHILTIPHILQMYDTKRKDLIINPIIVEEEKVENKWKHFLPPTQPFSISAKELKTVCPDSTKKQEIMNVCTVKTRLLSLAFIDYLRDIVSTKGNHLFKTKSGIPYLQNACCIEILQNPPISVLESLENQDTKGVIKKTIGIIHTTTNTIEKFKETRKPYLLLKKIQNPKEKENPKSDKKQNIFMSFEPIIYYAMVIHYCKLESEIYPIPEDLQTICSNKPIQTTEDYYDKNMPMVEKMDFLSSHQVKMDVKKAIELMNIVNKRNIIIINNQIDVTIENKIQTALDEFQEINHSLTKVSNVIETWIASEYNEFPTTNKTFILNFIKRNCSKKLNINIISQKLSILYDWENYKNIPISNLLQKMKSIFALFGIIYPSYLSSKQSKSKIEIPSRWELTFSDASYLENELHNYKKILQIYQQSSLLLPVFKNIIEHIQPLIVLLNNAFYFVEDNIEENEKTKKIYDLCIFCLELLIMIYIELINQPEIYVEIKNAINKTKQEQIEMQKLLIDSNKIIFHTEYGNITQLQLNNEEEDDMIEEEDIDFFADNKDNIKRELSDFLLDMISTIRTKQQVNVKESFMLSYDEIIKKMDFYRDREKQKIKDYFKGLTSDERKAEIILKKLHLGVFAIDNKKLVTYGKETGFYGDVFEKDKDKDNAQEQEQEQEQDDYMEDLGELIFENERDEDDNLDVQENENDYEDMNDNANEDYFDSEYN